MLLKNQINMLKMVANTSFDLQDKYNLDLQVVLNKETMSLSKRMV